MWFDRSELLFDRSELLFDRSALWFDRSELWFDRSELWFDRSELWFDRSELLFDRSELLFDRSAGEADAAAVGELSLLPVAGGQHARLRLLQRAPLRVRARQPLQHGQVHPAPVRRGQGARHR